MVIIQKKNVLDKRTNNYLNDIINNQSFPWFFLSNSALGGKEVEDNYSWVHLLYTEKRANSEWYPKFELSIKKIIDSFNLKGELYRARVGLHTSMNKQIIGTPHVDTDIPHKVILYYINQSDGSTYFYDNKKIIKKVNPVCNSALCFDGEFMHSSSKPIKSMKRLVLNLNILV